MVDGVTRKVLKRAIGCVFLQLASHQKAAAARASGRFKDEIIPIHTKV